jgi:predicted nucleic acid-binding protein
LSLIFADTSAFAKRYIPEPGSAWVRSWIEPQSGNLVLIAEVSVVELISVLARRQREGAVDASAFKRLRDDFLLHVDREYLVVRLHSQLMIEASQLVVRYPLRTLDAIQLACALECVRTLGHSPVFISADRNLLTAADAAGLATDDPHAHV